MYYFRDVNVYKFILLVFVLSIFRTTKHATVIRTEIKMAYTVHSGAITLHFTVFSQNKDYLNVKQQDKRCHHILSTLISHNTF